jgi:hypothetical protein
VKTRILGASLCVGLSLIACKSTPAPVPVQASASDLEQLAGDWEGEYSSEATGRSGSIQFKVVPGENQAQGDVLMVAGGSTVPYGAAVATGREQAHPGSQLLTIRFVNSAGGAVTGKLDPYHDADCDCEVETTFSGRQKGDTIEGTFTSTSSRSAGRTGGRWKVTRKRS